MTNLVKPTDVHNFTISESCPINPPCAHECFLMLKNGRKLTVTLRCDEMRILLNTYPGETTTDRIALFGIAALRFITGIKIAPYSKDYWRGHVATGNHAGNGLDETNETNETATQILTRLFQ
jgi:hypothetical protein